MRFGLIGREYDEVKALYFLFPNISEIIIFGSRARGDYKRVSDIDIALKGDLEKIDIAKIRDYFEDGTIPYTVDVVEYSKISNDEFKKNIDLEGVVL